MSEPTTPKPIEILLVEDNPIDVRLVLEALNEGKIRNNVHVVRDGVSALSFLRRDGTYGSAPRPGLVLLDLKLPKRDGREVLAEIKQDPDLRRIPVVIMTSSKAEEDIFRAYDLHANCYVTKPVDLNQFLTVVRSIREYWLEVVELPPSDPAIEA